MASMTRRERILTALRGGCPDRPPLAFDAHGAALAGALAHYGAADKDDLYRVAGIDGFSVWDWNAVMGRYTGAPKIAADGTPLDFWGNSYKHGCGLAACDTVAALEAHAWPRVEEFDYSRLHGQAVAIRARDMVVAAGHLGLGYQMHNTLRGNEKALLDVGDEEYMEAFIDRLATFTCGYLRALLEAGRGAIEVVRADDDVGTMDRLMISPAMWRRHYKPAWRRGRLVLDGGVSHLVLVKGTPGEVTAETRRVLDLFAPDGGLLIGPSQVFTEDMPTANIVAFFDAARHYPG